MMVKTASGNIFEMRTPEKLPRITKGTMTLARL
jgi:hypothetical protein